MRRVILVDGTHGASRADDFTNPQHHFARTLASAGCVPVSAARPFGWDTSVDGIEGKNYVWIAAGASLYNYAVPVLCEEKRVPSDELLVIAFSHGVQVALYAFALGLKGTLISVNPPIRSEMIEVAKTAKPNLKGWLNLSGDWRDVWAVLGAFGDRNLSLRREYPAGMALEVKVPGVHGAALRDEKHAAEWPAWIDKVMPR